MIDFNNLRVGQKVFFKNEKLPMEIIVKSKRYAVCVRSLDIDSDFELLYFEVERGAYFDSESAYEAFKEEPVYTLIDFKEQKRGPSNLIFNMYNFWSKEGCKQCLDDLIVGVHEISKRHGILLDIDFKKTK